MSAATEAKGSSPAKSTSGSANPWLIAVVISLATFMETLDTTIANVALRYIAGGLGVSSDEASWTVTTYLVSNAIVLVASSFLAKLFGRKRFFLACLALFTVASVLCGLAWNIESLLAFRVLQGFAGGGMVPVSQSILADAFPPEKRGQGFALFGIAVVVAPVVGPVLGGWLADNLSWHWCFLINGPVGLLEIALVYMLIQEPKNAAEERARLRKEGLRFDLVGFLLVATFLGSLEVMLDRGQTDDWFGSTFIIIFAVICAIAFMLMVPWELRHKNPVVDLRMVFSRQFGSCFLVMLGTGAILFSTTQFLPQLLQDQYGYTATWSGLALSPGGVVTMLMMFVVGRLTTLVQPKYLISAGAAIAAFAMYKLTSIYLDLNFGFFAWSRIYLGLGLPLLFIPITTASYAGIPPDKTDQASAMINMARNTGGSIGVSIANNVLAHREQFHQNRLVESVSTTDLGYRETLAQATNYFSQHGGSQNAQNQAIAWIGGQVQTQAAILAYIDVFWTLMLIAIGASLLAFVLRNINLSQAEGGVG